MSAGAAAEPLSPDPVKTGFFRFRSVAGGTLITNDLGRHLLLDDGEFRLFVGGRVPEGSPLEGRLRDGGFIRDRMDFDALAGLWGKRHSFLWQGPTLHVIVATLRCNHRCVYCHASSTPMEDPSTDMSEETARLVVDRIFESPSPALTIEFQGGEPLANWPVVRFVVEYARRKNRAAGKSLWLNLVTNLSLLDGEKLDWLLRRGVNFCTSLDGPADLHDRNRPWSGGASHATVAKWFGEIAARTKRRTFRIDALLTVTRRSLSKPREIVDAYVDVGARGVFLRPLNPYGLAAETWRTIGYDADEFLAFYRAALDRVLEVNRERTLRRPFFEQTARLYLAKILTDVDPNFLDLRSPCGAGIGQMAYDWDGSIYTCDEGRMLARMGDRTFRIGGVREGGYAEAAAHPTTRALAVASCLDNQVSCSTCAYKPYCGICPVQCYKDQGDIMGRMPTNARCRISRGILDALFERLQEPRNERIFRGWLRRKKGEGGDALYRRS
ncbi:MAG: His-Xaa-Ser system radical SAM maturase HxsB [Elusimicrobia bacterium]|nr:His-Xaa-Ser system radical SAM maturase HxsB [Elusimicrobiota bacterium]